METHNVAGTGLKRHRPGARRLLSNDSTRTTRTRRTASDASSASYEAETSYSSRMNTSMPAPPALEGLVESPQEIDVFGDGSTKFTTRPLMTSPKHDLDAFLDTYTSQDQSQSQSEPRHPSGHRRAETTPSSEPPTSPKSKWGTIRQHVVPESGESSHRRFATTADYTQVPSSASSAISFTPTSTPAKNQAPKSRLAARLGFRQVAEAAREVALDDANRFAAEILKACNATHFVDPIKSKLDPQYMPFMSTTSLNTVDMSAPVPDPLMGRGGRKGTAEMKQPPSLHSLPLPNKPVPTLKPLYQILHHYANVMADGLAAGLYLPYESHILASLLTPFIDPEKSSPRLEEERKFAYESFEILTRQWKPSTELEGLGRCIWCCKSAITVSSMRGRILQSLWGLLVPESQLQSRATSAVIFKTLLHALFGLQAALHVSFSSQPMPNDAQDKRILDDILCKVLEESSCGQLEVRSLEEEYNVLWLDQDDEKLVRKGVALEAFMTCLENGLNRTKRTLLRYYMETYWPTPAKPPFTPLLGAVRSRILSTFTRAAASMIPLPYDAAHSYTHLLLRTVQSQVLPELDALSQTKNSSSLPSIYKHIVEISTAAWLTGDVSLQRWVSRMLSDWYKHDQRWKQAIEGVLKATIEYRDWRNIFNLLPILGNQLEDGVRKALATFVLPLIYDRIIQEPPATPCEDLTDFLLSASKAYPQVFYKPLFSCAAATKDVAVANHFSILAGISRYVEGFWTQNADMICVALMSDTKPTSTEASGREWSRSRLGQSVLLIEMISQVQNTRHAREQAHGTNSEAKFVELMTFFNTLETRLGILLEAKEKGILLAPSQRLLYVVLFREIRLLTRSSKKPAWLARTISWFCNYHVDDEAADYFKKEIEESISQLRDLFSSTVENIRTSSNRRSTLAVSKSMQAYTSSPDAEASSLARFFTEKASLLSSLEKGFLRKALKLFVSMASALSTEDLKKLGPFIWDHHLEVPQDPSGTAAAAFLIMLCAERAPQDMSAIIEVDFRSSDAHTRLAAVRRMCALLNWRYQIGSQQVVADRAHRLFRTARPPLPFVQADMGSTEVVLEDTLTDEDKVPLELRKRLAEIGWTDEAKTVDERMHWIQTPMTLLPAHQIAGPTEQPVVKSPQKQPVRDAAEVTALLRRNSSTGGPLYGVRRRSIFVTPLASILPRMALLVFDPNVRIAMAVKIVLLDMLRNDPTLLTRPVHERLSGDEKDLQTAMSAFRAFLHVRRVIPPTAAHDMFNYLAGFLKYETKMSRTQANVLQDFSHSIPVLSNLASHVGGMSIREFRRAKLEAFFIPSGSLWFTDPAPEGEMFPRRPFQDQSPSLEDIAALSMIRTSQNFLFFTMLKRNPQDVHQVRRNLTTLELPGVRRNGSQLLQSQDFAPLKRSTLRSSDVSSDPTFTALSLMLARSYLVLVAQMFRSMSRHLNDKAELAILVDGINQILLAHGSDIGIVSQALVAFMIASVRFRRLFTTGGSYALFMPAVLKVYAEAQTGSGIRLAVEYAAIRFYALHRDAFIFQTLDILAETFSAPNADCEWLAETVFTLTSAMMKGVDSATPDPAGIHDINRVEEREALMVMTAEEKPQTFLAALRQGGSSNRNPTFIDFPDENEPKKLAFDNLVRLFLTVIAHDHTLLRAQHFLKFLRHLTPYLYAASSASRAVLQEGIDALGAILVRATTIRGKDEATSESTFSSAKRASDITLMRVDFLFLISSFCRAGGLVSPPTIRQALSLLLLVNRDEIHDSSAKLSTFISELCSAVLLRPDHPPIKYVHYFLKDAASAIKTVSPTSNVDFSPLFESLLDLASNVRYSRDTSFVQVLSEVVCPAALQACEIASTDLGLSVLVWKTSFVKLFALVTRLSGGSVLAALERYNPSYDFLGHIVFPLALELQTGPEIKASVQPLSYSQRSVVAATWIRLLAYVMSICTTDLTSIRKEKSPDRRRRDAPGRKSETPLLMTGLQVIKAIIIRGEADLTEFAPDVWLRLSVFLRTILEKGSADFATVIDRSPFPSPSPSPRNSGHFDFTLSDATSVSPGALYSPSSRQRPVFRSPRMLDYALWTWLELITVYRNPLTPHLRLLVLEKLGALDEELRLGQGIGGLRAGFTSRASFASWRVTSTIFSKPRRRLSGLPSPTASPYLGPSGSSTPRHSMEFGFSPESRQAGWAAPTFNSPSKQPATGPKIVHLGPTSPGGLLPNRMNSHGSTDSHTMSSSEAKVRSLSLIKQTYSRIRTVQSCHGYHLLLPLPDGTKDTVLSSPVAVTQDEPFTGHWTKLQALASVLQETKEIMGEFDDAFVQADEV